MKKLKLKDLIIGVIGALLILIVSQVLAQLVADLLTVVNIPVFACNILAGIIYILLSYLLLKMFAKKVLRMEIKELGIPKFKMNIKWIIVAVALPLLVTGIYLSLPGEFYNSGMNMKEVLGTLSAGIFFTGIGAGIVEEMVFRGFILNLLNKRVGRKTAIILPSLLFGFVHIIGMNFNILSCLQVIVAGTGVGIMFSFIALEEKSIWNSAIVHIVWNIVIIGGILNIGQNIDEYSIFSYVLKTKSFVITGGEFGIEASLIGILAYVIVIIFTYIGSRGKSITKRLCRKVGYQR